MIFNAETQRRKVRREKMICYTLCVLCGSAKMICYTLCVLCGSALKTAYPAGEQG